MVTALKTTVLSLLFAAVLMAADPTGVWKAEFTTPDGQQRQNTFHFKTDSTGKLTGKVVNEIGDAEIKDGKVSGDDITFSVVRKVRGNELTFQYNGRVYQDRLELKATLNGGQPSKSLLRRSSTAVAGQSCTAIVKRRSRGNLPASEQFGQVGSARLLREFIGCVRSG
jgi:hypothetical protein